MFPTLLFFITSTSGGQGDRKYDAMKSYLPVWLLVIALLCGVTRAEAFEVDGIYYDLNNEGAVVIRGDTPYSGDVVIPASINYFGEDFPVVSIRKSAFWGYSGLTTITLPESVTSIGDRAFSSCVNLEEIIVSANNPVYSSLDGVLYNKDKTELLKWPDKKLSVTIPESVTSIGDWAFSYCSSLTSVTIPESVTSIGDEAFYDCSGLTSIMLPESVTSIGGWAFFYCSSLTSVTIPESVESIGNCAFEDCRGLTSVTIPASVERLGTGVFSSCVNLEEIIVSANNPVYSSLDGVLYNKDKTELLKWPDKKLSVTIPESVTSIGESAFEDCYGLTTITLPESVTSIGDWAFSYCISLTSMTIPESVTSIGVGAFSYCSGLTSMTIPESVTSIGDEAFSYCSGLTSITLPESLTSIGVSTFSDCTGLTSITIPNSVESIGNGAFFRCSGLTTITLPESLTSIGRNTFSGCSGLTTITLPESLTSIGRNTFSGCSGLTTITIPESVTSIGDWAFYDCRGLTTITLPESLTSIGESAFSYCTGLTTITLPESLTSIGDYAFDKLESVTVHAVTPPEIGPNTFGNYGIPLYVPAGCKEAYQAAKYWRYFRNIQEMESSVETVLDSGACIYVENHTLHVENVDGDYWVYTITGQLVYAGRAATVSLTDAGVYVVCTSSLSQKVVVK